jgi:hypothetical protein
MSDKSLSLTFPQVEYIMEQTGETNPKTAIEAFAAIMKKEGIRPRFMPQVVTKLMERQRKQIK